MRFYGDELQYDAAERYEVSDDYTVYTFHLRDGLKWSDGQALTAHDFEYGAYCLLNPDMGSPAAYSWFAIKNASAYNSARSPIGPRWAMKPDDLTLEITLERPLNSFDRTIAVRGLYPLLPGFCGAGRQSAAGLIAGDHAVLRPRTSSQTGCWRAPWS